MISNCTISANSAEWDGGGLHSFDGVTGNCIVWGNSAPKGPELLDCRYAVITCCCIRGWTEGGEGNFDADPLFAAGPEMVFDLIIPANAASGNYTFLTAISRAGMGNFGILASDQCQFEIN